jgi:uncharacterized protein YegP (UPF0339 family)
MPVHRKAVIEVWKGKDSLFYFNLRSSNGKVVVQNPKGYERRVSLMETLNAMADVFKEGRFQIVESI